MNKLSLNSKFMGIVLGICVACCGIAWLGLAGMSSVSGDMKEIVQTVSPRKDNWFAIRGGQLSMAIRERDYFNESAADARRSLGERIDSDKKTIDDALGKIESLGASGDEDKAKLEEFKKTLADWWSNDRTVREKADKGEKDAAREASNSGRVMRDSMTKIVNDMIAANEKAMLSEYQGAQEHYASTRNLVLFATLGSVIGGLVLATFLIYQIRRSINAVVQGLAENSTQVESASEQVAQSAVKLSQSTTEQAASLQQTAASAQEMTSMVQRNMENAQSTATITASSQMSAQKGQQVVEEMSKAIAEINVSNQDIMSEVNSSNAQISEITKVIAEIGNKTKIINDIVFQTKLLSFNASVEAARAGEHGKGFAVVAEEVGNLARMSGTAAKEISDMLDASIQKVDLIVRETKTNVERLVLIGKQKVDAGSRIVDECGGVLNEIVKSVSQVSRMSADISSASQEQAQGVQEISRAVSQLDNVTQTNAGAAEQAASAADQLRDQAKSLKGTVQDLLAIVNGSGDETFESDSTSGSSHARASTVPAPRATAPIRPPMTAAAAAQGAKAARPALKVISKTAKKPGSGSSSGSGSGSGSGSAPTSGAGGKAQSAAKAGTSAPTAQPAKPAKPMKAPKATTNAVAKKQSAADKDGDPSPPLKLAAGGEVDIPSEDDPRFKDV